MEQLRERSREGRKETNRKPSTKTGKESMRDQAGQNGENVRRETGRRALKKPLRGRNGKNGKEETEGPVAGREAEADERKQKRNGQCRKRSESGKEGKHSWNSCGSEARKDERKQTGSRVREPGRKA